MIPPRLFPTSSLVTGVRFPASGEPFLLGRGKMPCRSMGGKVASKALDDNVYKQNFVGMLFRILAGS
jgi:hypothetical protein